MAKKTFAVFILSASKTENSAYHSEYICMTDDENRECRVRHGKLESVKL